MSDVAALFVRADSVYKTMDGVDAWDETRNALTWPGGCPVVAHPPCQLWSRLRAFSTRPIQERDLAPWTVSIVRAWGGVLEHPAGSQLWCSLAIPGGRLPAPGERDRFGGFTMTVPQWWWGHRAEKLTTLYFCGVNPADLPEVPMRIGEATHVIASSRQRQNDPGSRPRTTKSEREHTPKALAEWLVEAARRTALATTRAERRGA